MSLGKQAVTGLRIESGETVPISRSGSSVSWFQARGSCLFAVLQAAIVAEGTALDHIPAPVEGVCSDQQHRRALLINGGVAVASLYAAARVSS